MSSDYSLNTHNGVNQKSPEAQNKNDTNYDRVIFRLIHIILLFEIVYDPVRPANT